MHHPPRRSAPVDDDDWIMSPSPKTPAAIPGSPTEDAGKRTPGAATAQQAPNPMHMLGDIMSCVNDPNRLRGGAKGVWCVATTLGVVPHLCALLAIVLARLFAAVVVADAVTAAVLLAFLLYRAATGGLEKSPEEAALERHPLVFAIDGLPYVSSILIADLLDRVPALQHASLILFFVHSVSNLWAPCTRKTRSSGARRFLHPALILQTLVAVLLHNVVVFGALPSLAAVAYWNKLLAELISLTLAVCVIDEVVLRASWRGFVSLSATQLAPLAILCTPQSWARKVLFAALVSANDAPWNHVHATLLSCLDTPVVAAAATRVPGLGQFATILNAQVRRRETLKSFAAFCRSTIHSSAFIGNAACVLLAALLTQTNAFALLVGAVCCVVHVCVVYLGNRDVRTLGTLLARFAPTLLSSAKMLRSMLGVPSSK